eukprot:g14364.t1
MEILQEGTRCQNCGKRTIPGHRAYQCNEPELDAESRCERLLRCHPRLKIPFDRYFELPPEEKKQSKARSRLLDNEGDAIAKNPNAEMEDQDPDEAFHASQTVPDFDTEEELLAYMLTGECQGEPDARSGGQKAVAREGNRVHDGDEDGSSAPNELPASRRDSSEDLSGSARSVNSDATSERQATGPNIRSWGQNNATFRVPADVDTLEQLRALTAGASSAPEGAEQEESLTGNPLEEADDEVHRFAASIPLPTVAQVRADLQKRMLGDFDWEVSVDFLYSIPPSQINVCVSDDLALAEVAKAFRQTEGKRRRDVAKDLYNRLESRADVLRSEGDPLGVGAMRFLQEHRAEFEEVGLWEESYRPQIDTAEQQLKELEKKAASADGMRAILRRQRREIKPRFSQTFKRSVSLESKAPSGGPCSVKKNGGAAPSKSATPTAPKTAAQHARTADEKGKSPSSSDSTASGRFSESDEADSPGDGGAAYVPQQIVFSVNDGDRPRESFPAENRYQWKKAKKYHFPGHDALDGLPMEQREKWGSELLNQWEKRERDKQLDRLFEQPQCKGPLLWGGNKFLAKSGWLHFASAFQECFCHDFWSHEEGPEKVPNVGHFKRDCLAKPNWKGSRGRDIGRPHARSPFIGPYDVVLDEWEERKMINDMARTLLIDKRHQRMRMLKRMETPGVILRCRAYPELRGRVCHASVYFEADAKNHTHITVRLAEVRTECEKFFFQDKFLVLRRSDVYLGAGDLLAEMDKPARSSCVLDARVQLSRRAAGRKRGQSMLETIRVTRRERLAVFDNDVAVDLQGYRKVRSNSHSGSKIPRGALRKRKKRAGANRNKRKAKGDGGVDAAGEGAAGGGQRDLVDEHLDAADEHDENSEAGGRGGKGFAVGRDRSDSRAKTVFPEIEEEVESLQTTSFCEVYPIRFSRELLPACKLCPNCGSGLHTTLDECFYTQQSDQEHQVPFWRAYKICRQTWDRTPRWDMMRRFSQNMLANRRVFDHYSSKKCIVSRICR